MRFGAASGLRPLPAWKQAADFLCVQIGFSLEDLLAWRATVEVDVPVYAGVIVVASAGMARNLTIPGLTVPPDLVGAWRRTATPASTPPVIWSSPSATRGPSTACTSFPWRATARWRPAWSGTLSR